MLFRRELRDNQLPIAKTNAILMLVLMGFVLTAQTTSFAKATNDLVITPQEQRSATWNQGYSDGFLGHMGVPTKVSKWHTMDYWYGFTNGTLQLYWDKGYAAGSNPNMTKLMRAMFYITKMPPNTCNWQMFDSGRDAGEYNSNKTDAALPSRAWFGS